MSQKSIIFTAAIFYCLFFTGSLFANRYGSTVLAFYKSADHYTENNNPIKWHFEPEIKKLGLKIKYFNFNSGLPDIDDLENVRAVLTWYNSGVVENKNVGIKYVEFLKKALDLDTKIIIINSFGAYGHKEDGKVKWDLIQYIKPLFIEMGFSFKGFWTDDPKKLRITSKDKSMVEKGAKQGFNKSRHYQQIVPLRRDVRTYLTVKRTDKVKGMGNGNSSVILTSKNGGFALEQYVLSGNKLMLNASKFLKKSLFYDDGYQDVGVIIGDIDNKAFVKKNINFAFKYAKVYSDFIDTKNIGSMIAEDLFHYDVLLIATETVDKIPVKLCRQFVKNGGHLVFARFAELNADFQALLGIKEYSDNSTGFSEGFFIKPKFFMNNASVTGKKIDLNARRAILKKNGILGAVLNKSKSKEYPILWETSFGKGKILYWNTDLLLNDYKGFRGMIVQSLQYIHKGFITGVANIGMMMIDDFPAPLWNMNYREYRVNYYSNKLKNESDEGKRESLNGLIKGLKNYSNLTDTNFIKNIWVKDMQSFEKKFGFKYTTYAIFNYNRKTALNDNEKKYPVTDFYLAEDSVSFEMGNEVFKNGWELGFHGYNHMSLTIKKPEHYASIPWSGRDTMIKALSSARKEWSKLYSDYTFPFSYVAPHNIIDATGLSALGEAFPSIRVVSTLYSSSQGEQEQEFDWTSDRRFFMIPRMSSGYFTNSLDKNLMYDVIHNFGVVSHFIHPDDVFDEHRSSGFAGWKWMKSAFIKNFTEVKKCAPALRWMTVKDAFDEFQFYYATNIRVKKEGKTIHIESSDGSERYLFFRMKLKKGQKIKKTYNCKVVNFNKMSGDVILKTNEHKSKIALR